MKHFKVYISLLLFSLFTAYQVSITMFTHVHYINGVLVVHSHPYASDSEHTHTKSEVLVIDRLADYHTLQANSSNYICTTDIQFGVLEVDVDSTHPYVSYNRIPSLRAPPAHFLY